MYITVYDVLLVDRKTGEKKMVRQFTNPLIADKCKRELLIKTDFYHSVEIYPHSLKK